MIEPLLADGKIFHLGDTIWSAGFTQIRQQMSTLRMISYLIEASLPRPWNTKKRPVPELTYDPKVTLDYYGTVIEKEVWYLNKCDLQMFYSSKEAAYDNLRRELTVYQKDIEAAFTNLSTLQKNPKGQIIIPLS